MKSWMKSKTLQVKLFILELHPLVCRKCLFLTLSFSSDQIFLNLTYRIGLKLSGQLDSEVIQRIHIVLRLKYTKFQESYHYFFY